MMDGLLFKINPTWWLQVQLLGGPVRVFSICAVYTSLLTAGIVGFRYVDRGASIASYCDGTIYVLAFIQSMVMVLGGCNAVFRALTRDVNTKMLESHRLTPMSNAAVMSGYVIGANLQVLALFSIGVVVGTVVIRWGTIGTTGWLIGNLQLLLVAPMVWTATLAMGMGRDKPVNPAALLFVLGILGAPLLFLPGAGLLSGAYGGYLAITTMAGSSDVPGAVGAIPAFVALAMVVVWVRGAMRKFRRPDLPAFGPVRALGLLVIWLSVGCVSLLLAAEAVRRNIAGMGSPSSMLGDPTYLPACLAATASLAMLIAIFPLHASTFARIRRLRGATPQRPGDKLATAHMPLVCTALIFAFLLPLQDWMSWKLFAPAAVAVWAALLLLEGLLIMAHARGRKLTVVLGPYVILFWGGPPLLDVWAGALLGGSSSAYGVAPSQTPVFGFSPVGSLLPLFIEDIRLNVLPGVGFQVVLALIVWALGRRALRRVRCKDGL